MCLIWQDSFLHTSSHRSHLSDTLEADATSGHCGITYFFKGVKAFACVLRIFQFQIYLLFFMCFGPVLF